MSRAELVKAVGGDPQIALHLSKLLWPDDEEDLPGFRSEHVQVLKKQMEHWSRPAMARAGRQKIPVASFPPPCVNDRVLTAFRRH